MGYFLHGYIGDVSLLLFGDILENPPEDQPGGDNDFCIAG